MIYLLVVMILSIHLGRLIGEEMTDVRFKDFTRKPREIKFTADGEEYTAHPFVDTETLQDMFVAMNGARENITKALNDFFELALPSEEAARINARLKRGHKNPLDTHQATDIMTWLVEMFSARPTKLSANSSDSSQTEPTGTTSTDGALSTE